MGICVGCSSWLPQPPRLKIKRYVHDWYTTKSYGHKVNVLRDSDNGWVKDIKLIDEDRSMIRSNVHPFYIEDKQENLEYAAHTDAKGDWVAADPLTKVKQCQPLPEGYKPPPPRGTRRSSSRNDATPSTRRRHPYDTYSHGYNMHRPT